MDKILIIKANVHGQDGGFLEPAPLVPYEPDTDDLYRWLLWFDSSYAEELEEVDDVISTFIDVVKSISI